MNKTYTWLIVLLLLALSVGMLGTLFVRDLFEHAATVNIYYSGNGQLRLYKDGAPGGVEYVVYENAKDPYCMGVLYDHVDCKIVQDSTLVLNQSAGYALMDGSTLIAAYDIRRYELKP